MAVTMKAASKVKQLIVWLAIRGLIPVVVAEWLIRKGGLANA